MTDIKVSIIMPVYNSGEYLMTAVESILTQSLREIELILVDDGSTDGSSERCDEYAAKDSRVVVIHQKNGGICAARNAALEIARGKYIGFSDHDDEFLPNIFREIYELIEKSQADFIKFGNRTEVHDGKTIRKQINNAFSNATYVYNEIGNDIWKILNSGALACVWDGFYRLSFLNDSNIRFNNIYRYGGGEDIDFNNQCLLHANIMQFTSSTGYVHYIRNFFSTSAGYREAYLQLVPTHMTSTLRCLERCGIHVEDYQLEYTYWWIYNCLRPLCRLLAHKKCNLRNKDKKSCLKQLKESPSFFEWELYQKSVDFYKKSPKLALLYFLYKHRLFLSCVRIFKIHL